MEPTQEVADRVRRTILATEIRRRKVRRDHPFDHALHQRWEGKLDGLCRCASDAFGRGFLREAYQFVKEELTWS